MTLRSPSSRIVIGCVLMAACFVSKAAAQSTTELKPTTPLQIEIRAGETHSYALALSSGQYLRLVVDQKRLDLDFVATLFSPDGKKLLEAAGPKSPPRPLVITLVVESAGSYRFDVHSTEKDQATRHYEVSIEELRTANPQDSMRIA